MNYNHLENWKKRAISKSNGRGKFLSFIFENPVGKFDITGDMHGHTRNFSDGKRSADYYIETAQKNKLDFFSITDHDCLGRDDEMNGVEITCKLDPNNEIEILVYGYDFEKAHELVNNGTFPFLNRNFKIARNVELARRRIEICNKLHLTDKPLSLCDILEIKVTDENGKQETLTLSQIGISEKTIFSPGQPLLEQISYRGEIYPINYDFLIRKTFNQIHNSQNGMKFLMSKSAEDPNFSPDSSDHFLKKIVSNQSGELYVENAEFWPSASDVINFAEATGGVAILAHPFGYGKKINITTPELLDQVRNLGIDGIEVWHGYNQSDEIEYLYKYACANDLLMSMGSDTHGFISTQGDKTSPGLFPGVHGESRFIDNNIDNEIGSLYNLHYFGTGAWRGANQFDLDNLPASLNEVFINQELQLSSQKIKGKKQKNNTPHTNTTPSERQY